MPVTLNGGTVSPPPPARYGMTITAAKLEPRKDRIDLALGIDVDVDGTPRAMVLNLLVASEKPSAAGVVNANGLLLESIFAVAGADGDIDIGDPQTLGKLTGLSFEAKLSYSKSFPQLSEVTE